MLEDESRKFCRGMVNSVDGRDALGRLLKRVIGIESERQWVHFDKCERENSQSRRKQWSRLGPADVIFMYMPEAL